MGHRGSRGEAQETSSDAPGPDLSLPLRQLATCLRARSETLAEHADAAIRGAVPTYVAVPVESLKGSLSQHIETAACALERGESPSQVHDPSIAARRAREGIPIEDVMLAIRLCFQHVRERLLAEAEQLDVTGPARLEALRLLWEVADTVSRAYAVAHREEDLELARRAESARVQFVHALLSDGLSTPEMSLQASSFGLAGGGGRYRAYRCRPAPGREVETLSQLRRWADGRALHGIAAVVDGHVVGVVAGVDPFPEHFDIGVGPPVDLARVADSYQLACRVLDTAQQFGRAGPHTLDGLSLHVAVASEHAIGDVLVERFLGPLDELGEFGELLQDSLDAYMTNDLNITRAAEHLVVHKNTARYRINLIKKITGLSLSSAEEITQVWWALRRREWQRAARK